MQSAYKVLGVATDAGQETIEQAFLRVPADGSPRHDEARIAWQVLRDPQTRAAHDRKLAGTASASRPVVVTGDGPSPVVRFLWIALALVVLLFAGGGWLSMRNAERRAEAAKADQAAAQARAQAEKDRQEEAARLDEQRRADQAKAEAAERRLAAESRAIANEQLYRNARVEGAVAQVRRQETLQREAQQAAEERRQHYEAQRRIEDDKRRVRELCYQNYGRPNC